MSIGQSPCTNRGAANFGAGGDILFSVDELVELTRLAPGTVVFNHLEAIDHCPTTRAGLRERLEAEGLLDKAWIPEDGEARAFEPTGSESTPSVKPSGHQKPGFQKWLTSKLA